VSCYQVLSLTRYILIRISATPSDMGDDLIAVFKHSNVTSLFCYENYEDNIDYLVVKA
jgi:hypothetical protein